jgi:hypothetical protein
MNAVGVVPIIRKDNEECNETGWLTFRSTLNLI